MRLASQKGLDEVTVAEIAELAGVSSRTFFNHFTAKEDAIAVPAMAFDSAAEAAFVTDTRAPLPAALVALTRSFVVRLVEDPDSGNLDLHGLLAAANKDPKIASLVLRFFTMVEDRLAGLIGERSGLPAEDLSCQVAAATTVALARVALTKWSRGPADRSGQSVVETMETAFNLWEASFASVSRAGLLTD